jgi:hypothetical protein
MTQREGALARGNKLRLGGAQFRREVRDLPYSEGCAVLADALEAKPDEAIGSLRVGHFLAAPKQMGEAKVQALLHLADIIRRSPNLRIRDLTDPEKQRLAVELRSRCSPVEKAA